MATRKKKKATTKTVKTSHEAWEELQVAMERAGRLDEMFTVYADLLGDGVSQAEAVFECCRKFCPVIMEGTEKSPKKEFETVPPPSEPVPEKPWKKDSRLLCQKIVYMPPTHENETNTLDAIDWVSAALRKCVHSMSTKEKLDLGVPPSEEAVSMLSWALDNQNQFWTGVWRNAKLTKENLMIESRKRDDGRELISLAEELRQELKAQGHVDYIGQEPRPAKSKAG